MSDASLDEQFAAWLSMKDYLIEDDFLVFDVDGMPDDPYSEEGLRVAEAELLARFSSIDDALAEPNRELFDKFMRYVGQTMARGGHGEWTNHPLVDDGSPYRGLRFPWREATLGIPTLITSAVARRTGEEWAFVYRHLVQRMRAAEPGALGALAEPGSSDSSPDSRDKE